MTYGENYFNVLKRNIDGSSVSSDSLFMLDKMNIAELADTSSELGNTDFNTIYLPSMKKVMGLLEKSSSKDIHDMEILVAKQQEIMESIVDHETAHSLEYIHKRIGMQIYNEKLLPKLLDGSIGVYDEASFEKNRQALRDFMNSEFNKLYSPNEMDYQSFSSFIEEYYIPDGPFGLTNRIADIDNYVSDIYIENDFVNVLLDNNSTVDKKFQNLRNLLYENNNPEEEYSILRSIQIFIDPRFEGTKQLDKVKASKKFDEFLNIDISDLNISPDLFQATTPDDFQYLKMIAIMKELRAIVKKLREYSYITAGDYIKYKEEYNINSNSTSLLSSKLAKVIYIKELQNENGKEQEIKEILKNDKYLSLKEKSSNNSETSDSKIENKNSVLSELPKPEFKESLKKIGHQEDYANDLTMIMQESISSIEKHLETNIVQSKFNDGEINKDDSKIIKNILKKPISNDFYQINDKLQMSRLELFQEIKESRNYKLLEEKVEEFKHQLGSLEFKNNSAGNMNNMVEDYISGNEFLYSMNGNQSVNTFIHCFIDDSISMNSKIDNKYSLMDYQIVNTMLIIDLFKDIDGVNIVVSSFPKDNNSMNLLYDSNKSKNVNIIALEGSKTGSPLYQSIIESNIKLKNSDINKDIINVFMSDGDDTMNPSKFQISENLFKNIVKDSYFVQFKGNEIENISNTFENRYSIINNKDDISNSLLSTLDKIVDNLDNKLELNNDFSYLDDKSNKKI